MDNIVYVFVKYIARRFGAAELTEIHCNRARLFDQLNESFAFEIFNNISTWILLRK